jgi:acyl-CoA reductase-like NAD-dependent aldehyde dehydrogenase
MALHYDETHQYTQIWINQYNVLYNNVPFGGKKQSGIGTRDQPFLDSATGPNRGVFY